MASEQSYSDLLEQALRQLRVLVHDDVEIRDEGRILEGPGGTELVSAHRHDPDRWVDRRSRWGNPFKIEEDGGEYERHESVDLYRGWFYGHVERDEWDPETLRGDRLGCWCLPRACHGIVIMNYLAETHEPQQTLATDGGRTIDDQPDPEDDPFACSLCGCYLGTSKRIAGEDYCDACQRDIGLKSPLQRCLECGHRAPEEHMEAIDVSPPDEYYPEFEYLCRSCTSDEVDSGEGVETDGGLNQQSRGECTHRLVKTDSSPTAGEARSEYTSIEGSDDD